MRVRDLMDELRKLDPEDKVRVWDFGYGDMVEANGLEVQPGYITIVYNDPEYADQHEESEDTNTL